MTGNRIEKVVIIGGGTAGWMAASMLAKAFGPLLSIELVESEEIGIVGVGEATIPQIRLVNSFLGLNEDEVLVASQGTFKLGIQFNDWLRHGHSYLHAFGELGMPLGPLPFQHYWLRQRAAGKGADLWAYSLNSKAALSHRFARTANPAPTPPGELRYAYHFDAGLYGQYLRRYAEQRGVKRREGKVSEVRLRGEDGFIAAVALESGESLTGDLFLDCTGFRSLLLGQALEVGFDDWSEFLRCDRAIAVPCARREPLLPYTQSSAGTAGWQWRIPLQHRTGNGHVYCSEFMSDDEACAQLLARLDGEALAEPRMLRFRSGMRQRLWERNCVALGLASGFVEPLESTAIHLIQSGVARLLSLFPDRHCDPALAAEFNRQARFEFESVRDLLVLHYRANQRAEPFWQQVRQTRPSPGLAAKIEVFRASGQIFRVHEELFTEGSWLQVLLGQGIEPLRYHPLADALAQAKLDEFLGNLRTLVETTLAGLPEHGRFVAEHCRAAT